MPCLIPAVHWICTGSEGFPAMPPVRSIASVLSVHDVRSDRQDRLGVQRVSISGVLPQLVHEGGHGPGGEMVNAIVVVAKLGEITFGLIVGHQPGLVPQHSHCCVADRRQAIRHDGQARDSERHGPQRGVVVQRHFEAFIGILVMHVVNDVHGIDVHIGEPVHHLLELLR